MNGTNEKYQIIAYLFLLIFNLSYYIIYYLIIYLQRMTRTYFFAI